MNKNNLSIVRQQFAQCVFNHKIHEKAADRLEIKQNKIKWLNIIFLALVLIFLILQTHFPEETIFSSLSIGITIAEILFIFFQKEFSIEDQAKEHKKIALQYLALRDKYKNFIVDITNNLENEKTVSMRDLLQEQYQIISSLSLQTTYKDYEKAQSSLSVKNNTNEEFTWSDAEINHFLPKDLHI